MSKKGLGRGLGALIPEIDVADHDRENIQELDIELVDSNPKQPRKSFDEAKLAELAASIKEHGVVQPIVVRPKRDRYEIVAGERRWRASKLAGLKKIPALVREFSEAEVMEIALIENLQREELNPLEEAEAYRVLLEEFGLTQDELARRVGKSRPQITNTLRLLQLGKAAREEVKGGRLSMGHAKVLLSVTEPDLQADLVKMTAEQGLSVRELEAAVRRAQGAEVKRRARKSQPTKSVELQAVEERLNEVFGTPVRVSGTDEKGKIEITFFGQEGLERILEALGIGNGSQARVQRRPFTV